MILQTQIEEKKEELEALREDAEALEKELENAVASAEGADLIKELRSKKKTLMAYIQDLMDEVAGMQVGFKHVGEPDGEDTETAYQEGSFGHALLHSTIIEDEEDSSDESRQDDSISFEGGTDWDRSPENATGEPLEQTEENIEDAEGTE
jgi:hypothetical protein